MIPSLFTSHHRLFYNEELKEIDYNELSQLKLITAPTFQAHHHHHPTSTTTTSPWLRTTMATAPAPPPHHHGSAPPWPPHLVQISLLLSLSPTATTHPLLPSIHKNRSESEQICLCV
ncbi:hypothetical protein HanIR_Chr10g0493581 [Helianthus annuus]|nr:hypothetical protein HanIR_Chr10g0493581 [Helianthus annuus]